jgi:hypothetical protein
MSRMRNSGRISRKANRACLFNCVSRWWIPGPAGRWPTPRLTSGIATLSAYIPDLRAKARMAGLAEAVVRVAAVVQAREGLRRTSIPMDLGLLLPGRLDRADPEAPVGAAAVPGKSIRPAFSAEFRSRTKTAWRSLRPSIPAGIPDALSIST